MNKLLKVLVPMVIMLALSFGIALAANNTFPTSLNTWGSGNIIEQEWANALETKIGIDSSADASSLDYKLNHITLSNTLDASNNLITNIGNAGTDFNSSGGLTLAENLSLKDNNKLFFDTAESKGIQYNSDMGDMQLIGGNLWSSGEMYIGANSAEDGSGEWEPYIRLSASGVAKIQNLGQGNAADRHLDLNFTDSVRMTTGDVRLNTTGQYAIIKSDNIATGAKTFQFPNISGTLVTTAGALADVNLGDGYKLITDEVRAYDGAGLKLYDDGGNGIFVEDGGQVGIGTETPAGILDAQGGGANAYFFSDSVSGQNPFIYIYGWDLNRDNQQEYMRMRVDNYGRFIFDGTIESFYYGKPFQMVDDTGVKFGAGKDFQILYDETTNDELKLTNDWGTTYLTVKKVGAVCNFNFNEGLVFLKSDGDVGINTITPDAKLQVVGDTKLGDDNTNYASFAADGELSLTGTARVERHLDIGAASWDHGASAPTEGHDGAFVYLAFDNSADDEVHYTSIIPYRWDSSTNVEVAVDWYYTGTQDNGTACWALDYKSIKAGEAVTGGNTTIAKTSAGTHTTGQMVRTTFTTEVLAANLERHDTIALRLYRDVDGGGDSGDTLATDAKLLNVHLHFTENSLGKGL